MSRKFLSVVSLAVFTVVAFWYGARPSKQSTVVITPAVKPAASLNSPAAGSTPVLKAPLEVPLVQAGTTESMPVPGNGAQPIAGPGPAAKGQGMPDLEEPAKIEADAIALNIRHYSQRFGGNPVGSNAEIVKEMTGGNPKGATYLPSELQRLNDRGELIDRWGTPYFFHQNSANFMEVRSAGPDKKLWTSDDVKTR